MKFYLITLFLHMICNVSFAQEIIYQGSIVHIDGIINKGEWDDSKVYIFKESEFVKSKIYLKHDGANLLLAYINENIKDTTYLYPEFFIDTKLNKGNDWHADDYWFHVSAQDCYAVGKRENYDNCSPDYSFWRASPNHPFGNAYKAIPAFEISVPFKLLNISKGHNIGMCLSLMLYPQEIRLNIPITAHEDKPSSWTEYKIIK